MKLVRDFYFTRLFFVLLTGIACLFVFAYFFEVVFLSLAKISFFVLMGLLMTDVILLFRSADGIFARRETTERLANGSDNELLIYIENRYGFGIRTVVIDEIPFQFQKRDLHFDDVLKRGETKVIRYELRPVKRGEYSFGSLNIFVESALMLVRRRYRFEKGKMVPVYPSFLQMRQYELMAVSNRLVDVGVKRIRRIGHSMEFEQVREHATGDDYRAMNWKATARSGKLMVNNYQDEKSQQVYCVIDKGRTMKMPFEGLSLLDYSINASLVISNIALHKDDKAGLITFSNTLSNLLPADKKRTQIDNILRVLYNQKTKYLESDYEMLAARVMKNIRQRSLLLLFTNFETLSGMRRQLPYLKRIAKQHLLLTIFFENTELHHLTDKPATTTEEIYHKTIAEKFAFEKKLIVKELNQFGIHTLLTPPQGLNVNVINRYLEFKARGMI